MAEVKDREQCLAPETDSKVDSKDECQGHEPDLQDECQAQEPALATECQAQDPDPDLAIECHARDPDPDLATECRAQDPDIAAGCPAPEVDSEDECPDQDKILEEQLQQRIEDKPGKLSGSAASTELLEKVKEWTSQIFRDVTKTPPCGRPGNLLVFGEGAVPLLAPKKNRVMMAGTTLGKGRVLFVSTEALARGIGGTKAQGNIAKLQANMKAWLLHKQHADETEGAVKLHNTPDLSSVDKETVIVFSQAFNHVLSRYEEVLEFVTQGGGLLLAFRPWFWFTQQRDKASVSDVRGAVRQFLTPLGVALGKEKIWGGQHGFVLPHASTESDDVYNSLLASHLGHALECCCEDDLGNMHEHTDMMECILTTAPPYARKALQQQINAVFKRCHQHIKNCVPTPKKKLTDADKLGAVAMCNKMSLLGYGFEKCPGVKLFPGDVESHESLQECVDIEMTSHVSRFHATGYYLPAGVQMKIVVLERKGRDREWLVRVGAHSDRLYKKTALSRWPEIVMTRPLKGKEFTIQSPFGGLVYLKSPDNNTSIKLQMFNVVEAPLFDLNDPQNVEKWEARRKAPAPWADIQGKYVRLTLPSSCVRDVNNMSDIMNTWDKVIESNHDLRGTDVTKQRGEWIVADVQISAGAMHSGCPIMGHMGMTRGDKGLLNYEKLTSAGFWGAFHELGHNMQRGMWTFAGTREITCNIFTLHAIEVVAGIPVSEHPKFRQSMDRYVTYLSSDTSFADLPKKPMTGLGFYIHLASIFGWTAYKAVFREYENLAQKDRPKDNQDKIDQWLTRFSKQVKVSIAPIMTLWKMGASDVAVTSLEDLKPFLPDDKLTEKVPDKVDKIIEAYPGLIRKI